MSGECEIIHNCTKELKRFYFPYNENEIPLNGIYILFEKGELGHKHERIVRVGTHTGQNQLRSRLKQHFLNKNKDRSIFRKHIGRAILAKNNDSFLELWDKDLTSKKNRETFSPLINFNYQKKIEDEVSQYTQDNFSFCVFQIETKEERLDIEKKIISTLSWCNECTKTEKWLGNFSPKEKIVKSGLWLINELYKTPFNANDIETFVNLVRKT